MILVDSRVGSKELLPIIRRLGVECELSDLAYGDVAIEGKGPTGPLTVGIERKSLHDMLHCIDDSRYNIQRIGMQKLYKVSILMVEGVWAVGTPPHMDGLLIESHTGGGSFGMCKYRSRPVLYSKLYRYLISVSLSGVIITLPRTLYETAYQICEFYHYFQKPWDKHTSLLEVQKMAIPTLTGKPSLTRKWANDIEDVGVKLSMEAEALFRTPIRLATAEETEWIRIKGIGMPTARRIVREVNGL